MYLRLDLLWAFHENINCHVRSGVSNSVKQKNQKHRNVRNLSPTLNYQLLYIVNYLTDMMLNYLWDLCRRFTFGSSLWLSYAPFKMLIHQLCPYFFPYMRKITYQESRFDYHHVSLKASKCTLTSNMPLLLSLDQIYIHENITHHKDDI